MNDPHLPTAKQFKAKRAAASVRHAQGKYADAPEIDFNAAKKLPKALIKFPRATLKRVKTKV